MNYFRCLTGTPNTKRPCLCADGRQRITLPVYCDDGPIVKFKVMELAGGRTQCFIGDVFNLDGVLFYHEVYQGEHDWLRTDRSTTVQLPFETYKWRDVEMDYSANTIKLDGITYGGSSQAPRHNKICVFNSLSGNQAAFCFISEIEIIINNVVAYRLVPRDDVELNCGYYFDEINHVRYYVDSGYANLKYSEI